MSSSHHLASSFAPRTIFVPITVPPITAPSTPPTSSPLSPQPLHHRDHSHHDPRRPQGLFRGSCLVVMPQQGLRLCCVFRGELDAWPIRCALESKLTRFQSWTSSYIQMIKSRCLKSDFRYGESKGLIRAHGYAVSSLMDTAYWYSESLIFKISSFKLQNARLFANILPS
ncbi:hypothetical protein Tco_0490649 [Tanacetum coccineum]